MTAPRRVVFAAGIAKLMERCRLSGEVTVIEQDGGTSTTWAGKASDDDINVEVRITDLGRTAIKEAGNG